MSYHVYGDCSVSVGGREEDSLWIAKKIAHLKEYRGRPPLPWLEEPHANTVTAKEN